VVVYNDGMLAEIYSGFRAPPPPAAATAAAAAAAASGDAVVVEHPDWTEGVADGDVGLVTGLFGDDDPWEAATSDAADAGDAAAAPADEGGTPEGSPAAAAAAATTGQPADEEASLF
jgi:hypothetical protein